MRNLFTDCSSADFQLSEDNSKSVYTHRRGFHMNI